MQAACLPHLFAKYPSIHPFPPSSALLCVLGRLYTTVVAPFVPLGSARLDSTCYCYIISLLLLLLLLIWERLVRGAVVNCFKDKGEKEEPPSRSQTTSTLLFNSTKEMTQRPNWKSRTLLDNNSSKLKLRLQLPRLRADADEIKSKQNRSMEWKIDLSRRGRKEECDRATGRSTGIAYVMWWVCILNWRERQCAMTAFRCAVLYGMCRMCTAHGLRRVGKEKKENLRFIQECRFIQFSAIHSGHTAMKEKWNKPHDLVCA